MRQPKYSPRVYATLRAQGLSNRAIARELGVNEASVRRALRKPAELGGRVTIIVIEE